MSLSAELYKWKETLHTLVIINLPMLAIMLFIDRVTGWHKVAVDIILFSFIAREAVIEPLGRFFKWGRVEGQAGDKKIKAEFESKEKPQQ